ncbi:Cro/CI family transcriptional regulator [Pseudomonas sp. SP16.1]|uniref:Cro/CI family transcriptional regulator n=1 Tax=Pseudomonas sp. SP16.1 TaxID=3458854 RepID=UPI00404555FF
MKKTPLSVLVAERGQAAVAKALGVSAPAIAKALLADRSIVVTEHADGTFSAEELRPFPAQPSAKKAVA